jgi:hypothetical protein
MTLDAGILAASMSGVSILVTVGGGFYFMGRVTGRMDAHEANTKRIEADVHEMKVLLISSAVDASRLNRAEADIQNLEDDVRNLRKGVGWIKDEGARGTDREY